MTMNQIKTVGVPVNQWISLGSFCDIVSLQDDNNIFINNLEQQFYFEDSSDLMFIRYLMDAVKTTDTSEQRNTVIVNKNGNTYRAVIRAEGAEDKTIGRYHDVICCSNIAAFLINK